MIEFGTGANKVQVECLTRRPEQEIELRLTKPRGGARRTVILEEPSGIQFARLRIAAIEADDEIAGQFPEPHRPPDRIGDETDLERLARFTEYQIAINDCAQKRHNYRTHPDHAVYANVLIEVVKTLSEESVTLDDLVPEAFKMSVLQALLEVWETPLGGAVSPVETTTTANPPAADSPESTPSSPPGGTPSPPSPPPSSTE